MWRYHLHLGAREMALPSCRPRSLPAPNCELVAVELVWPSRRWRCPTNSARNLRGLLFHSDQGSQGGFNRSSQHWIVELILDTCLVLRQAFSSLVFFEALCSTAWISWAFQRDRSVPFGKYWRRRPFVFSFVPRCQGLCGSAKKTFTPDSVVDRA